MDRANFLSIEFPYCYPLDGANLLHSEDGANLLHNEDRANLLYNWLDNSPTGLSYSMISNYYFEIKTEEGRVK